MPKKKYSLAVLFILISAPLLFSQELRVNKVTLAETDISARENKVLDANGNASAIVKARLALKDIRFSADLGITKMEERNGEIWLWVPPGTGKISVITSGRDTIDVKMPSALEEYSVCVVLFTVIIDQKTQYIDLPSLSFSTKPASAGIFINDLYQGKSPLTISMLPDSFSYRAELKRHETITGKDVLTPGGRDLNLKFRSLNRFFVQANTDMLFPYNRNTGLTAGIIGTTGLYFSCIFPVKNIEQDLTITSLFDDYSYDDYYLSNEGSKPVLIRHHYFVLGATRHLWHNFIVSGGVAYGKTELYQSFKAIPYNDEIPSYELIALRKDKENLSAGFDIGLSYWIKKKILVSLNSASFVNNYPVKDDFGNVIMLKRKIIISDLRLGIGYSF
jgi:hypothetical protein